MDDVRGRLKELRKTDPQLAKKLERKVKRKKARQRAQVRNASIRGSDKERLFNAEGVADDQSRGLLDSKVETEDENSHSDIEVEYVIETLEEQIKRMGLAPVGRKRIDGSDDEDDDAEDDSEATAHSELVEEYNEGFKHVFERFQANPDDEEEEEEDGEDESGDVARRLLELGGKDGGDDDDDDANEKPKVSKKAVKMQLRPPVSALKQATRRPDVVEFWDITSPDPFMLVWLKAYRNTVSVPIHWSHKRKYLQGKKGIEKPPFKLPEHIEATKISEIRQVLQEKESMKTLKQKMREKARPKMHKMDIDYQTLHDAFFKYVVRPPLRPFGDLYYEGKEFETKMRRFRPGKVSERLMNALGMVSEATPPPWLYNMQRYGPPPSYPNVVVPGLNAPIPPGASYGFHPQGWGQPPTDAFGNPLFIAPLGADNDSRYTGGEERCWGEIEMISDDDAMSDDEMRDDEDGQSSGVATPATTVGGSLTPFDGMDSVSGLKSIESIGGIVSLSSGLETPESVDIRRRGGISTTTPKPYTILREQKAPAQPGALFASGTVYRMPGAGGAITPFGLRSAGIATPLGLAPGGTITPFGLAATGGALTPMGAGGSTPIVGGVRTPGSAAPGITVAINPADMEQEGVFAGDVIRQQLKQHEEAKFKTLKAAGQYEVPSGQTKKPVKKGKKAKDDKAFKF